MLTAPAWITVGFLIDRSTRGRTAALRCFAFFTYYLTCEMAGLLLLAPATVARLVMDANSRLYRRWVKAIHTAWATMLLRGIYRLYDLRIVVEGEELVEPPPLLVLSRHSSAGDTLFPPVLVTGRHGILFRYVLKGELQWDPCLGLAGLLTPNVFIRRDPRYHDEDVEKIGSLIEDLREDEAVVIWPEGTRFTEEKRTRLLQRLEEKGELELLAYARELENLLPPRPGGAMALLERNPGADVLIIRHTGWEGIATFGDLWRGSFVGKTLRVAFERIPYAELPRTRSTLVEWLQDQWRETDAWVSKHRSRSGEMP